MNVYELKRHLDTTVIIMAHVLFIVLFAWFIKLLYFNG